MRYLLDELVFDGKVVRCDGWALPEDLGDRLTVRLLDEEDNVLPIPVEMTARPDVISAILGVENRSEDYGFRFTFPPEDRVYVYIDMRAENLAIDHARKRIEVAGLITEYRKAHSFFGRMRKRRQERRARKADKRKA
ncbi:MAG: hypothetical protein IJL78_10805 [Lachnospiraceae bacterium]|nr:hypothetical protein [Lachnospiraceae bacterium]